MNESWSTVSEPVSLPSCGQSVSSNVNRLSLQLQHFNYLQSDNAVFVFSGEPSDDKSLLLKVGCHTCIQLLWNSLWTHVPFFYKYRVFFFERRFYWTSKKLEEETIYKQVLQANIGSFSQSNQSGRKVLDLLTIQEKEKVFMSSMRVSFRGGFSSKQIFFR